MANLCSVDDCGHPVTAMEFCRMHYGRFKKTGDPLTPPKKTGRGRNPLKPCTIEDCELDASAKGMCSTHYNRKRKTGRTHLERDPEIRRQWLRGLLDQAPDDLCRDWPFGASPRDGRPTTVIYEGRQLLPTTAIMLMKEPRPTSRHGALHACDRPICCAPWHLRWGTQKENIEDMHERKRSALHRFAALREAILSDPDRYVDLLPLI